MRELTLYITKHRVNLLESSQKSFSQKGYNLCGRILRECWFNAVQVIIPGVWWRQFLGRGVADQEQLDNDFLEKIGATKGEYLYGNRETIFSQIL